MRSTLSIGDLSRRTGVAPHVLRHWETVGLLSPGRAGMDRRYAEDDVVRVGAVRCAQASGLPLADIARLLAGDGVRALLARHHAELGRRIEDLRRAQELLGHALVCTEDRLLACPSARRAALAALADG